MKKKYAVMDGNTAAAHVAYAFTEVAAIYPITPSSPMAEKVDEWSAKGKKNLFGSTVDVIQMQSEAGAAGTCHGSLQAGALTTTFTSSQGLMLMIPAMYAMGGQFLPNVMHIASRVVTSNHHSIFGDHTDFMTCRMTGYAMLMSSSPQEAMDLGAVAHLSAIHEKYAFMHCFDGFRTSHEMQRIETLDYEDLRGLVDYDALKAFRTQALNPEHPTNRGNNVNPDIYFQCKEGANVKSATVPETVQHYMDEINKLTGRDYKLFNYYGAPDAEEVIVVMCSASEALKETVRSRLSTSRMPSRQPVRRSLSSTAPRKLVRLVSRYTSTYAPHSIRLAEPTSRSSAVVTVCPPRTPPLASWLQFMTISHRTSPRTTSPSVSMMT